MLCKHCHSKFSPRQFNQRYCSQRCQKLAFQKHKDESYPKDRFQWLNARWTPTAVEDRIWVKTGIENVRLYLEHRCRWMFPAEIALEIDTNPSEVRHLLSKFDLTYKNEYELNHETRKVWI